MSHREVYCTGGLTNPRPWRGRCRASYSNTGGPPLPRKRVPFSKKGSLLGFPTQVDIVRWSGAKGCLDCGSAHQVLTELHFVWLQWSYGNWFCQVHKPLCRKFTEIYICCQILKCILCFSGLVDILKDEIKFIHAFVIAFKQQDNRMTASLRSMISLFQKMFGDHFWENAILEATHWNYHEKNEELRGKSRPPIREEW